MSPPSQETGFSRQADNICYVNICFISCVLKILSFKDCLVYQNSFLQIPKCQPGYVSYIFLNFLHFEPYVSLKRRVVPDF